MINERVKQIRLKLKLSQAKFGEKLGVGRDVIANIENNRVKPKDRFIQHLCALFDIDEQWLLCGEGEMFIRGEKSAVLLLCDEFNLDSLDRKIIESYLKLSPTHRKALKAYVRSLTEE